MGYRPYDSDVAKTAFNDFKKNLIIFNNMLADKKFLVGDSLSIADIQLAVVCHTIFRYFFDEKTRNIVKNVVEHYKNVASFECFKSVYGPV